MRHIDKLLKYAGTDHSVKREIWHGAQDWSFWMTPLTIAEKQQATKNAKSDDVTDFALQLLCAKAQDENGQKLFNAAADLPVLRQRVSSTLLDKLVMAMIADDEEVTEEVDMKSADAGAGKGKRAAG